MTVDYRHLYLCLHEKHEPTVIECGDGSTFVSCGDPDCEKWGGKTAEFRHFHKTAAA